MLNTLESLLPTFNHISVIYTPGRILKSDGRPVFLLDHFALGRPARGGGRPATWSSNKGPAMFLSLHTLQLCSCFPRKISQSGGYFVGENLPNFPPPLPLPYSLFLVLKASRQHHLQGLEILVFKPQHTYHLPSLSFS
ncbi:hypothetical protein HYC85_022750 [Camellia sinensis]|uniref:Uncharacterized protein n=1 Tax=Camellia sinensis TaxID=4442 RepID=A0A7J7GEX2_CAMSI|nr:hypothetical protein HYC85_022750 [Camellia sinensis]